MYHVGFPHNDLQEKSKHNAIGTIHRGEDVKEESDVKGQKVVHTTSPYVSYHVSALVNPGEYRSGSFVCSMDRRQHKAYVSTYTADTNNPYLYVLSCESNTYNYKSKVLGLIIGRETCFRCCGYGLKSGSKVVIVRHGKVMTSHKNVTIQNWINVAEGAVPEVTVTIQYPMHVHTGKYECLSVGPDGVENTKGMKRIDAMLT